MYPEKELIRSEAEKFFYDFKLAEKEYNRLSRLREEKLSPIGYISYASLFIGVMALVALKINDYKGPVLYILLSAIALASALYILITQILIGIYEKKGKNKRDKEFAEVKSSYEKLLGKRDYYVALKECDYDEEKANSLLKKIKAEEKLAASEARKKGTVVKKRFDDSVCVYCKSGICSFESDETVYSFRCNPENCQWRSKKKL